MNHKATTRVLTSLLLAAACIGLLAGATASATQADQRGARDASFAPTILTYQGHLLDDEGEPVEDGTYPMAFSLWDAETEGAEIWGPEIHNVEVSGGFFAVTLGSSEPIFPTSLEPATYLEIQIGGETLSPRQQLASTAFSLIATVAQNAMSAESAMRADDAGMLDGEHADFYRSWANLTGVPEGFADGVDNSGAYTISTGLVLDDGELSVDFTEVAPLYHEHDEYAPIGHEHDEYALADHNHDTRYYTRSALQSSGTASVHWGNLTHIPLGFADGEDDVAGYDPGDGIDVLGAEISVDVSDLVGDGLTEFKNNLEVDFADVAAAAHTHEGGDITSGTVDQAYIDDDIARDSEIVTYTAGEGLELTGTEFSVDEIHRDRITPTLTLPPIGSIIAWHKSMTHTPALPDGWVECNGQVITDTESPYYNLRVPKLNSDVQDGSIDSGMFLRGGSSSGVMQEDATAANGLSATTDASQQSSVGDTGSSGQPDRFAGPGATVHISSSDDETRPVNMTVVWIMKIRQ